jgi:hypothetical protein
VEHCGSMGKPPRQGIARGERSKSAKTSRLSGRAATRPWAISELKAWSLGRPGPVWAVPGQFSGEVIRVKASSPVLMSTVGQGLAGDSTTAATRIKHRTHRRPQTGRGDIGGRLHQTNRDQLAGQWLPCGVACNFFAIVEKHLETPTSQQCLQSPSRHTPLLSESAGNLKEYHTDGI